MMDWITGIVYAARGDVSFGLTENGRVYVRWYDETYKPRMASGDTADAAVAAAMAGRDYPEPVTT